MENREMYYAYDNPDGGVSRIAKFVGVVPYAYENGEWVYMPGLVKILFDVTADFYEISKDEAEKLIKEYFS